MNRGLGMDFGAGGKRAVSLAAALLPIFFLLLAVLATPAAGALPDGRAYERVTPANKNGGDVGGPALDGAAASAFGQSATDGNSIAYASLSSFAGAQSAEIFTSYVSSRGASGWSTQAISPPAAIPRRLLDFPLFLFFARDLSTGLFGWVEPILAAEAPPGFASLYLRKADGTYRVVTNATPASLSPFSYHVTFAGASPDLGHVIFEANDALTPDAPLGDRSVYEWSGGSPRLVSVLPGPGGVAATGAGAGDGKHDNFADVVSSDGSRIFWTDGGDQLYVREDGTETLKLNASRRALPLGDGTAALRAITPNGSTAIFTDPVPLTDEPNDNGGGIYRYDLQANALHDLTPYAGGDPGIQGVLGMSDDGSSVFFVATAVLADGAIAGENNLYVAKGGGIELIAVLGDDDGSDWSDNFEARTARVTPDGANLVFLSKASLTGYDNTDALKGQPDPELFLYAAGERRLVCVSCDPSGARPTGGASIPVGTSRSYEPRIVSADGSQVLFNSNDALVAADFNGRQDVYEYEEGAPHLISSGTSGDMSALVETTAAGRDVFFTTRARLVAADRDDGSDMYDARVGGGFPADSEALPCAEEACRGPLSGPPVTGPGAATLWPGEGALRSTRREAGACRFRGRPARRHRARADGHRAKVRRIGDKSGSRRCPVKKRKRGEA